MGVDRRSRAAQALTILYSPAASANAVFDGTQATPGLTDAWIQAPTLDDRRWPATAQVGKVNGIRGIRPLTGQSLRSIYTVSL